MIDILLATYNGEEYLRQQIDSIICQSYTNWRLIIRDDSSSDGTLAIIKDYVKRYPNKIILVDENTPNLGSSKSFIRLLDFVSNDYFMFTDQDDVWLPNKVELSIRKMHELESAYGIDKPLLVCSDAECIDACGNLLCSSFFQSQKFIDTTDDAIKLLALNVIQGSTSLMNRNVISYVKPIPDFVLHDQWIGVITAHYGKVVYLPEQLIRYRQHGHNVLGALNVGSTYFFNKLIHFKKQFRIYKSFYINLPFRVNLLKWFFNKLYYSIKRF